VNDGIKLSKLKINTGFINGLPKKWLAFYQSLRNTNHVKEYELASLCGKLKYEENLINNIYDTNKEKTIVHVTLLSTTFFSSSIVQDFQDSPDDEEDTRSSQEYMNDLEDEYQVRALLAKSKSSSASAPSSSSGKNKGLIAESYNGDEEEVSSDDYDVTEVKALMALADEERVSVGKESAKNDLLRKYDKFGSSRNTQIVPLNMLGPDLNGKAIKNHTLKRDIEFHFIPTQYQLADIFTKPLDKPTFKRLVVELAKASKNFKVFFSTPTGGIYGEVGVNTFRNAIGAHYLPHSSEYVAPLSIDIVRSWFKTSGYGEAVPAKGSLKKSLLPPRWRMNIDYANIFWEDIIIKLNKKHREKVVPYTRFLSLLMMHKMKKGYRDGELTLYPTQVFSVNNWALKPNKPKEPPLKVHILAICAADTLVVFKAPKTSSKSKSVSQGTKPGAKPGHKKLSTSSKQPSVSNKEAIKGGSYKAPTSSKTGISKKRKESNSAMDSNPSQPLVSTLVDTGIHKEDQQATGGPTSLGVTGEARANPQLNSGMSAFNLNEPIYSASFVIHSEPTSGNDASAVSTAEANLGKSAPNDPVIVVDDSNEDKEDEVHTTTEDTSVPKSSSPSSLLPELKDLPFKFNELTEAVKGLKQQVHELEIELPRDLKEIPYKLEEFIKTVTSLTSQVAELKTLQWELPAEFVSLPVQVASVQAKLKTLDALAGLLLNVTKALNKFA
ncbi:hypothetical protein Tco_0580188, partial [Tanacetum coccineum]